MAVPEAIRNVERPKNTIVVAYGKDKNLYAVKTRIGCERVEGSANPRPKTGATIGHIVKANNSSGWKYVPKDGILRISSDEIDRKDWGNVELCIRLSNDLLEDLKKVYSQDEAEQLYCSAILRSCYPGIRDSALKDRYGECFLSEIIPGVALSKNTVSDLLDRVGKANLRIRKFMMGRLDKVEPSHHLIIDSTLKRNKSIMNDLSEFSRKIGSDYPMISVMYAFDLEIMEPVTMEVYPGNMIDSRAFTDFVKNHGLTQGIIVVDKGFPRTSAEEALETNDDLHYLIPLKENNSLIERYGMLEFDSTVKGYEHIIGKKLYIGDRWLYSFRDSKRAARDERTYIDANREGFDGWDYDINRRVFGSIVFECDLDLDLDVVYKTYECRWTIELMFRMYKIILDFSDTREHSDYNVVASEFVNFLATIITSRLFSCFDKAGLLDSMTYGEIMNVLKGAKKQRSEKGDWNTIRVIEKNAKVLEKLGLAGNLIHVTNPVGRPKKVS